MIKPNYLTAILAFGLILVSVGFLTGGGLAASIVLWLAINVLITASFRFVTLIGELNFAVAGFVGIGAYVAGSGTVLLDLPFYLTLVLAAFIAGLISIGFGYVTLRAKGPYFMLISFAFTEVIRMIYTKTEIIGGSSGMIGIFPPEYLERYYPVFVVTVVIGMLWLLWKLEKSDYGKVLIAIRNNDAIVETVGINVHFAKVLCVGISSFVAGIAGALMAYGNNVISPGDFSFLLSVYALAYLKVGGESHISGAVVGAIVLTLLAQFALSFGPYEHIFYGAAIVLSVTILPEGLIGLKRYFKKSSPAPVVATKSSV
ncbi:branched-chain amino acid ABC transporter permease [Advenella faeciporci]|uniref:Branched-chain amino acid ABC transporter permease n=1 Tax=Advenella faeciporci TaxID=797535 RepID=A0A918JL96_9BURK|nr:branched-chain amino acid ABC transporter permease [Advenella faeciporci]GGW81586.1 branched-chain amino acid ABC transporter permease [Advenella faeciporci]